MNPSDPLGVRQSLTVDNRTYDIYLPETLPGVDPAKWSRRPRTIRILLENLVRNFHPKLGNVEAVRALANGTEVPADAEFPFYPARVLLQDFTGVPVLADLAAMRDAA